MIIATAIYVTPSVEIVFLFLVILELQANFNDYTSVDDVNDYHTSSYTIHVLEKDKTGSGM